MRWARVVTQAGAPPRLAVQSEHGLHLLGGGQATSLPDLLRRGELAEAGASALGSPPAAPGDVRLVAPLADAPSVRDFMAFEQHVDGVSRLAAGTRHIPDVWYRQPLFYFSNPASFCGPYDDVPIPPGCSAFDAELEIAAIIGTGGSDLTLAQAQASIAGYTILNDWSARDLQFAEMQGPLGPCKGKDSVTTLGPWFVTADHLQERRSGTSFDLEMRWWVGDEFIGSDRADSMSWSFAEMVSYASRGTTLRPGDVFGSGTCGGGCLAELWGRHGRDARPPLRAGDIVRLSVDELGSTANLVTVGTAVVQPLTRRQPRDPAAWPAGPPAGAFPQPEERPSGGT